ncbi:hypothetical protein [Streptomyces spectabilis]|uniref:Uncharacterized protein n=1 Tax=Streptomyces spectabilis TaxID=68270 RepID=A0A7W8B321_STRST|nr:hypothetical protein [Streptomyces spectabilis]MBB5109413.1 hypothetical protein [Streptomyces spectabilis]GGV41931.1 hypothetical protein GCM10010245_65810 [Streptomyces spectabilis]
MPPEGSWHGGEIHDLAEATGLPYDTIRPKIRTIQERGWGLL